MLLLCPAWKALYHPLALKKTLIFLQFFSQTGWFCLISNPPIPKEFQSYCCKCLQNCPPHKVGWGLIESELWSPSYVMNLGLVLWGGDSGNSCFSFARDTMDTIGRECSVFMASGRSLPWVTKSWNSLGLSINKYLILHHFIISKALKFPTTRGKTEMTMTEMNHFLISTPTITHIKI